MPLTSSARRESRRQQMAARMARLANVEVVPATRAGGRLITVAVQSAEAAGRGNADPARLLNYIRPWWSTLHRVGLQGTLLCSGWSCEQVAAVVTDRVQALPVSPGSRHIFHERHFLVRDYLRSIDDPYVFVTDGSDVAFRRDPFEQVRRSDGERRLFIGREPRWILFCKCVRQEMRRQFGRIWHPLRPVLNPGIIGGRREIVVKALDAICRLIESLGERIIASDMCVVNRAIYDTFAPHELATGAPLHSRFKGWEFETTSAIMHK